MVTGRDCKRKGRENTNHCPLEWEDMAHFPVVAQFPVDYVIESSHSGALISWNDINSAFSDCSPTSQEERLGHGRLQLSLSIRSSVLAHPEPFHSQQGILVNRVSDDGGGGTGYWMRV